MKFVLYFLSVWFGGALVRIAANTSRKQRSAETTPRLFSRARLLPIPVSDQQPDERSSGDTLRTHSGDSKAPRMSDHPRMTHHPLAGVRISYPTHQEKNTVRSYFAHAARHLKVLLDRFFRNVVLGRRRQ